MKKLTPEDLKKMRVKPAGRTSFARTAIFNMNEGDAILLEPADWNQKRPPTQLISILSKRTGRKFQMLKSLDKPGWVIERIS